MPTARSELRKKAQSAILQHAFFRWESAVVLAGTLLLAVLLPRPFPWWPVWGWPLLGLLGLTILVYTSLTDAETNARVVSELFQPAFDLGSGAQLPGDLEVPVPDRLEGFVAGFAAGGKSLAGVEEVRYLFVPRLSLAGGGNHDAAPPRIGADDRLDLSDLPGVRDGAAAELGYDITHLFQG